MSLSIDLSGLRREAEDVLRLNRRTGVVTDSDKSFDLTCPSVSGYPFQWFWDSCFHAIVLSRFDIERAKNELRTLVSAAHPDGFIGHVIYWEADEFLAHSRRYAVARSRGVSTTIQPPVLARAGRGSLAAQWGQRLPPGDAADRVAVPPMANSASGSRQ
jgi:hypothetical protein